MTSLEIVSIALFVCKVLKTKWPVKAALIAISDVVLVGEIRDKETSEIADEVLQLKNGAVNTLEEHGK